VRVVEWSREAESLAFETVGRGGVRYLHLVLPATTVLQVQSERELTPWWAVVVQEVVRQGGLWSMQWVGSFSDMADTVVGRWETTFQALRGQWDRCQCLWRVGQAWVRGPPRALSILTTVADAGAWGPCAQDVSARPLSLRPLWTYYSHVVLTPRKRSSTRSPRDNGGRLPMVCYSATVFHKARGQAVLCHFASGRP
jgi:hypothetical protein